MTRRKYIQLMIMIIVLITTGVSIIQSATLNNNNIFVIESFIINLMISFYLLVKSAARHAYSFEISFWMFGIVFFGLAPLVQYLSDWTAWGLVTNNDELIKCNLMILIWYIAFWCGRKLRFRIVFGQKSPKIFKTKASGFYRRRLILLSLISLAFAGYLVYKTGISALIFRGNRSNTVSDSSAINLLTYHVFRNTILFTLVLLIINKKEGKGLKALTYLVGFLFLLACAPTGLSRYMAGAFYVGVLIILIGKERCNTWISIMFFLGLTAVFPLLNIFRYSTGMYSYSEFIELSRRVFSNTYQTGNYDTHNMIISGMHYVREFGHSHGRQVLGALLFFVPRSVWRTKPIGTGAEVISSLNQFGFLNVSMPLVGESYINFGIIGVVIIGIAIGCATFRLDESYWKCSNIYDCIYVLYPFNVFYFFFLQRGDLMSAGAYLIANAVTGFLAWNTASGNRKHY